MTNKTWVKSRLLGEVWWSSLVKEIIRNNDIRESLEKKLLRRYLSEQTIASWISVTQKCCEELMLCEFWYTRSHMTPAWRLLQWLFQNTCEQLLSRIRSYSKSVETFEQLTKNYFFSYNKTLFHSVSDFFKILFHKFYFLKFYLTGIYLLTVN